MVKEKLEFFLTFALKKMKCAMKKKIRLAFSSCPNDTFIFHALLHGLIDTGDFVFEPYISDVEDLNRQAFKGVYDVTKLSSYACLCLKERYSILSAGGALGYGCGPLLVAGEEKTINSETRIAVPGEYTTAYMLLRLWKPEAVNVTVTRFDEIIPGICSGLFQAGLVIHEGRFIYAEFGLNSIIDLGAWWEEETGLPVPLGCIAARTSLDEETRREIASMVRSSVEYALSHRGDSADYVRSLARELDPGVINNHIDLYVNDFTLDLGEEGRRALAVLEEKGRSRGLL